MSVKHLKDPTQSVGHTCENYADQINANRVLGKAQLRLEDGYGYQIRKTPPQSLSRQITEKSPARLKE